ncbi:MAG: hypothetical protein RIQ84_1430 [Pseudomonadota bacterium]|jgi:hypothetical protein
MSVLASLKLTQSKRPNQLSPVVVRRTKLMKQIWQQIQLAKAIQVGETYQPVRYRTIRDAETGLSRSIEQAKQVKQWWWTIDSNKICLAIRYGAKQIDIAKGKNAVEVANLEQVVVALEKIKQAVDLGELDEQIELASGTLKARFKK